MAQRVSRAEFEYEFVGAATLQNCTPTSFGLYPAKCGYEITKYRLFEPDRIILAAKLAEHHLNGHTDVTCIGGVLRGSFQFGYFNVIVVGTYAHIENG